MATNHFNYRHYDLGSFAVFVNGKQIPSEGLLVCLDHEKSSVMWYRTLFEGSGIHHSNVRLQKNHDMYIAGYFMLLFDLTQDLGASECHLPHMHNRIIRIELKFGKALAYSITCLLYLEFHNSIRIDFLRNVSRDFWWTLQILCTLRDLKKNFSAYFLRISSQIQSRGLAPSLSMWILTQRKVHTG